jgi:hypothetical protein
LHSLLEEPIIKVEKLGRGPIGDVECFNCHSKGHRKADCWKKGGGKEGQGPRSRDRKEKRSEGNKEGQKDLANTAGEEDGVWMAVSSNSNDENMPDNEFDNFIVSDDDLFIFEDEDNKEREVVSDLATHLKKLLKISDTNNFTPPCDNPNDLFNTQDQTNSSDDVAMQVSSESDSKVEINPYWSKITIDELQGLKNPIKAPLSNTDLMPELKDVSELDISEDSIIFIMAPPNSLCSTNSEKDSLEDSPESISDEEMMDSVVDEGEEGLTTFNAAMLVKVEGSVEGTQTELYDSRALHHMSPYHNHFENYVSIVSKSITAADKHYF